MNTITLTVLCGLIALCWCSAAPSPKLYLVDVGRDGSQFYSLNLATKEKTVLLELGEEYIPLFVVPYDQGFILGEASGNLYLQFETFNVPENVTSWSEQAVITPRGVFYDPHNQMLLGISATTMLQNGLFQYDPAQGSAAQLQLSPHSFVEMVTAFYDPTAQLYYSLWATPHRFEYRWWVVDVATNTSTIGPQKLDWAAELKVHPSMTLNTKTGNLAVVVEDQADQKSALELFSIDPKTGAILKVHDISGGFGWGRCNPSTWGDDAWYGVCRNHNGTIALVSVQLATPSLSIIEQFDVNGEPILAMAFSADWMNIRQRDFRISRFRS